MSETRDRLLALYGTAEPPPRALRLTAGPLSAELIDGNLRTIRYAGREVLRAIAYVVRDRDWGTYAPLLSDLAVEQAGDSFTVTYRARCDAASGQSLAYAARITGEADGSLAFAVTATPTTDFETNRCGFCVLHPIVGVAGTPVVVERVDGSVERSPLPDLIEPWQPFMEMRAITHEVCPGLKATCRMEGDTFEMEDQRNWSDASYKTYVRPLALPWPYVMPRDVENRQSVTLTLRDRRAERSAPAGAAGPVEIALGPAAGRHPDFGLVLTPEETAATLEARAELAAVGPQLLVCHYDPTVGPTAGHGLAALRGFAAVAAAYPAKLVLECVVPGERAPAEELAATAALVREAGLVLSAVAVCPSVDRQSTPPGSAWPACPPLEEVYAGARAAFPGLPLGGGMFSYFTELNRKRPPVALLNFVTHCTCPIVHAADDLSVMQTLEALPFITRSARAIVGDRPYRIGPVTLGMRQNPYGSRTLDNPDDRRVPMAAWDPRQRGLFAAAWLAGYAARVADAGLASLTAGALTGPFGLLAQPGEAGAVRPQYFVAQGLAGLAGRERLACRSDGEDRVLALAARDGGGTLLWLANLTADEQAVAVPGLRDVRATLLDETTLPGLRAGRLPAPEPCPDGRLRLRPFAVARLEAAA